MRALAFSVVGLLMVSGCTRWTAIRPEQLPALNGDTIERANSTAVAATTRTVERPDGRTVEIRGAFHARLTGRNGHQVVAEHPVISTIEGRTLIVRGSNVAPQTIPLPNLSSVEIGQTNKGAVAVGYSLLGVVLAVLASVIVVKVL